MDDVIAHGGGARPGAVAVWIQAIRAPSLSAAAIPVLLGVAVAAREGFFSFGRMILALVGAMAIQAGTNLINDYYDFRSGADSEQSLGPSMVIQRGLLSADQVWRGGIVAFAIGALIGLVLVYLCGWPILAIGIPSVAAGYFYTASPVSLAYVALGELTVFIFMGPAIVVGAYFVMAMHFSASAIWASIPLGFLVAGILHANNIRDIESDTRHGKRTLATMLGRAGANYELITLDVAAYVTTIVAIIAARDSVDCAGRVYHDSARARSDSNHDARERSEEAESRIVPIDSASHGVRLVDDCRVPDRGLHWLVKAAVTTVRSTESRRPSPR